MPNFIAWRCSDCQIVLEFCILLLPDCQTVLRPALSDCQINQRISCIASPLIAKFYCVMLLWLPKTKRESAVAIFAEKSAYSITTHSNLAIRSYHFFSRDIAQFDLIAKTEKWKSLESHSLQSIAPTQFPPTTLWLFSCCHFLFPVTFRDLTQVLKVTNKRAWSRNHCWRCGFLNHHTAISAYFITFQKNMHAAWVFFWQKSLFSSLCLTSLNLPRLQDGRITQLRLQQHQLEDVCLFTSIPPPKIS